MYKPKAAHTNDATLPLIVYYHGGGFIAGTLDTEDGQCRHLAAKFPALVISIDYPKVSDLSTKLDTIIQGYGIPSVSWSKSKAGELVQNISKTILCGGSAGAMLAIEVAYHYLTQGDTKDINGLMLLFAVAFPYTYGEDGRFKEHFKAWEENGSAQVPIISRKLAEHIWCKTHLVFCVLKIMFLLTKSFAAAHYDADFKSPKHFPGLADDEEIAKFPPTYIVNAQKDCFRDDGFLLEKRLKEAGVPTKLDYYDGLPHYFHGWSFPNSF